MEKIKDLPSGEYIVSSYEAKKGKYGVGYIVEVIDQNNEEYLVWSNSFLSDYISAKSPRRKFRIIIENNMIEVIGYSKKVILS